jgi:hypothetical protein
MNKHDISYQKAKESFEESKSKFIESALFACSLLGVLGFILLVLPS